MATKEKVQKKSQNNSKPLETEELKDKAFLDAYQELCDKHRRGLTASPSWRFSQDGRDFRLVIDLAVNRWPKITENNV